MPNEPVEGEVEILKNAKVIAIVGATNTERRPGNIAPKFLLDHGLSFIPVNPTETEIHGQKVYKSLSDIPEKIDIVSVFRAAENVPPIMDEAIKLGAKVVWMQEGVIHEEAAAKGRAAGLTVIMDRCIHCAVRDNPDDFPAVNQ
jgi:predicted CoA-binding protein